MKMLVGEGQSEEFIEVLGFRLLSDSKKEINNSFLFICNKQGNGHKDVGVWTNSESFAWSLLQCKTDWRTEFTGS